MLALRPRPRWHDDSWVTPRPAPRPRRRAWLVDVLWLATVAILSAIWCLSASSQLSAVFDEPIYLEEGLQRWRSGSTAGLMKLGTMPLPVDAQTLPLYLWEQWRGYPLDLVTEFTPALHWARVATLGFWWILLGYTWVSARALGGRWAGRLAVAALACDPNFLAHATLATTDIAVTACLLALFYHYWRGRDRSWQTRIGWPAFWFGASILAKASGLVFGVLGLGVIEIARLWRQQQLQGTGHWLPTPAQLKQPVLDLWQIGILGMGMVFLYCWSDWAPLPSLVQWATSLPAGEMRTVALWVGEHLCIFSNAGVGLVRQVSHNLRGHGVYILGVTHPRAVWYYFPVLLTMKATLLFLVAPIAILVVGWKRLRKDHWLSNWPLLTALGLLLFTPLCRVQIGIRFMLPLLCLATIGLAVGWVQTIQGSPLRSRRRMMFGATVLAVLLVALGTLHNWPHALCHINPLWGGREAGYRLVSDSNYDWGQGLKELAEWQQQAGRGTVDVWYFGKDPSVNEPPLRSLPLHTLGFANADAVGACVQGRCLAVSMSLVHGGIGLRDPAIQHVQAFLSREQPIARTTTFLIYDFRTPVPSRQH